MNNFKFFRNTTKQLFQFEITNHIQRSDGSQLCWCHDYSDAIREWMSELYFNNTYTNPNRHLIHIPSIDRTCELMETPIIKERPNNCPLFSVKVKIWRSNWDWMIVHLSYPIEYTIQR